MVAWSTERKPQTKTLNVKATVFSRLPLISGGLIFSCLLPGLHPIISSAPPLFMALGPKKAKEQNRTEKTPTASQPIHPINVGTSRE